MQLLVSSLHVWSSVSQVLVACSPQQADPAAALQHLGLKRLPEESENVGEK